MKKSRNTISLLKKKLRKKGNSWTSSFWTDQIFVRPIWKRMSLYATARQKTILNLEVNPKSGPTTIILAVKRSKIMKRLINNLWSTWTSTMKISKRILNTLSWLRGLTKRNNSRLWLKSEKCNWKSSRKDTRNLSMSLKLSTEPNNSAVLCSLTVN